MEMQVYSVSTREAFLSTLGVKIVFEELDHGKEFGKRSSSFTRVLQLHHRMNQFNTATTFAKRLEEEALLKYVTALDHTVDCAHVTDRFGHYGLVSVALCQHLRDSNLLDDPSSATTAIASIAATEIPSALTIHSYVNRLLDRIAKPANITEALTSHSFRRGGAQHANGSEHLTARWIFDRSAWNVSTTNIAYIHVFNIRNEDHKVAKVFSGHDQKCRVQLADLSAFDDNTLDKILSVQALLFST